MEDRADSQPFVTDGIRAGLTRREAVQRVTAMLGGARAGRRRAPGGVRVRRRARSIRRWRRASAPSRAADVALLDEIADTILPETSTPGAKAAKTGAFMALMVTDAYTDADQRGVPRGPATLDEACRTKTSRSVHAGHARRSGSRCSRRSTANRRRPWRSDRRRTLARAGRAPHLPTTNPRTTSA